MAIELSDKAVSAVKRFMAKEKEPVQALRVQVVGGGCAGMTYNMSFEKAVQAGDKAFEKDGVKVVCDLKSYFFLNGTELDYEENLMGANFVFKNPNAARSCSCGTSFSV